MRGPFYPKRVATSLHARLILWLLALLGTVWIALWTNTWVTAADTAERNIDQRLRITATLLQSLYMGQPQASLPTALPLVGNTLLKTPPGVGWEAPVNFEVVSLEYGLLARTPDFPAEARHARPGFTNQDIEDRGWRIFTLDVPQQQLVSRVAVQQSVGTARADTLRNDFALPLVWLLPVFALLAVFSVWRGLAPLRRIERAIESQDPIAPKPLGIAHDRVPMELHRLVDTLDHLMHRIGEVLTRQRAFTAGAGHELRTPLAGCRSQLQVAQRSHNHELRQRALGKALQTLDHMSELVDQLLTLARLDPTAAELDTHPLELGQLVRRLVTERQDAAASGSIELVLEASMDTALPIEGNATLMEALVSNLLDNAMQFSPTGATVQISLGHGGGFAQIRVRDEGPGIPHDELEYLFSPFFCSQGKDSYGLGLAIVQAVAKAHGGQAMAQQPEHGGAEIIVYLPLTSRQPAYWP